MRRTRSIVALVTALIITRFEAPAARATTFVMMDEATLVHSSAAVVVGTVTAIETGTNTDGGLHTYVHVWPQRVLKGALGAEEVVLREPGGRDGAREERVFGAPEFHVGERCLLFLSRNADGTLQTNSLAMGKFGVQRNEAGRSIAVREFGPGADVLLPASGELVQAPRHRERFLSLLRRVRDLTRTDRARRTAARPLTAVPAELQSLPTHVEDAYTLLGSPPGRWFEPDSGQPVTYLVDSTGDATLGFPVSQALVDAALAQWTNTSAWNLTLEDGGTTAPGPFSQCDTNRLVFNDPASELPDPSNCGGTLALGGYCMNSQAEVVNGTKFVRIVAGKITFNNGFSSCQLWTQCNVAEVATHELGHTIGLGHSSDANATMNAYAHFDGRCAQIETDDIAGVTFIYPTSLTPFPTLTTTRAASVTTTPTSTATPSFTAIPSYTPSRTATATLTSTATRVPSATRTGTPTATRAPSTTPTATSTTTRIPSATPSRTPTSTGVPSATPTVTLTQTPVPSATPTSTRTDTPSPASTVTPSPTWSATPTATLAPSTTPTPSPASFGISGRVTYYSNGLPVGSVTVNPHGPAAPPVQTDATGWYDLTGLQGASWSIQPTKTGDFGPAINVLDAVAILETITGKRTLNATQLLACDVSGDGTVDINDAILVLRYAVGQITRFPVAEICDSDWGFVPEPQSSEPEEIQPPRVGDNTCQAGAINFDPLIASANAQNFSAVLFGDCSGNWAPASGGSATGLRPITGQVRVGSARTTAKSSQLRAPIYIDVRQPFHALTVELRYDPTAVKPGGIRLAPSAAGALVLSDVDNGGTARFSLVSLQPITGGTIGTLEFEWLGKRHAGVSVVYAAVDGDGVTQNADIR